jgi:argininosuccinate synthase
MKKKVLLAFSGGLDTSFCVKYLTHEKNMEVHTATVQTGGFSAEELDEIAQRANNLGVVSHVVLDETAAFYKDCIRFLLFGNMLKNNTYPLSVSAERIFQATAIAHYANQIKADAIAHGSTGAGNDQVRFDMAFNILCPGVEIITPIRDNKLSREEEIAYLQKHGVGMNFEKAAYSINKGLWGTSVGGKETLTSHQALPESAFPTQVTKTAPEKITIQFEKGEPVALNGEKLESVTLIQQLTEIAAPFGIGRDVHVGDTIIGIKGRVGFEAAAPIILIKAHHLLEKHVLTKWQLYWKDQLSAWYGNWLHEGQFLDPTMRDIEAFLEHTQQYVTGEVSITLAPYRFHLDGITSNYDLMQSQFGKYGEMNNGWSGDDVKGFTKIFGNQALIYNRVHANEA